MCFEFFHIQSAFTDFLRLELTFLFLNLIYIDVFRAEDLHKYGMCVDINYYCADPIRSRSSPYSTWSVNLKSKAVYK